MSGLLALILAAPVLFGGGEIDHLKAAVESVQARCFECHMDGNVKGGLRLDETSGWLDAIEPGNLEDSEFVYRVRLPGEDPDAMPPKGERLDPGAVRAIEAWILAGGSVQELEGHLSDAIRRGKNSAAELAALAERVGAKIEPSRAAGGRILEERLVVTWSHRPVPPTPKRTEALEPIAGQVVEIVLAKTAVTDAALGALPELPALERLHLERTDVTDEGVRAVLKKAPGLRYLNLYSTRVSPGILEDTSSMASLEEVVLFDTKAASTGPQDPFAKLREHRPRRLHLRGPSEGPATVLEETSVGRFEPAATPLPMDRQRAMQRGTRLVRGLRDPGLVLRVDVRGRTVGTFRSTPFEGWTLAFGTTFQELSSGGLVLSRPNAPAGEPWAMEVSERGDVLWTFRDDERFPGGITALVVEERR